MARSPSPKDRSHLPPFGYVAFSEVIMKVGASFPFYPFIDDVLQFFNVAPF